MTPHPETVDGWLHWMEQQHPQAIALGLDRVATVAARLGVTTWACSVITVAGTNGKGSTVACLEALALAHGVRVGCYTSPHLVAYNERIRIQGQNISDHALCESFKVIAESRGDIPLTFFEFGTLAALWLMQQAKLDLIVLEVGMGGRLDAVNVIDPTVSVITSIDFDHMDWLGHTLVEIATEKAGICRSKRPAVLGELLPESVQQKLLQQETPCYVYSRDVIATQVVDEELGINSPWNWRMAHWQWNDLPMPSIMLKNAALALAAYHLAMSHTITLPALKQALRHIALKGRFQILQNHPLVILDVAHNPQAMRQLTQRLYNQACLGKTFAVVGMLSDKDIRSSLEAMHEIIDVWWVAGLPGPRGASAEIIADILHSQTAHPIHTATTIQQAYTNALAQAKEHDRIVVFGSFVTVGSVLAGDSHE